MVPMPDKRVDGATAGQSHPLNSTTMQARRAASTPPTRVADRLRQDVQTNVLPGHPGLSPAPHLNNSEAVIPL